MTVRPVRFLCPNGHLGFAPLKTESFHRGVEQRPDYIVADSGSCDVGPGPLALDISSSPLEWQAHDLEEMLIAARRLGVPMIIGSAGDTGSNSRVDLFVRVVQDLALKHKMPRFKVGFFYSEVPKAVLESRLARGETIEGLGTRGPLTHADLATTDRIVAVAGVHPFIRLLDMGADVIIGGRCSDAAIFAGPAIRAGIPESQAYCLGKALECSSFCAEPYAGKESVIGEVSGEEVRLTPMLPTQRCTPASVASHMMYERANPFYEHVLGGVLDMRGCRYEPVDERTCRITGAEFAASPRLRVKLEGAGQVGERFVGFAAIRDPHAVANVEHIVRWSRDEVTRRFGQAGYELFFHLYGKNGVMAELEPAKRAAHEICVMVEAVAGAREVAEGVAVTALRQLFYGPRNVPDYKGTAGGVAFLLDEVLAAKPACKWTVHHTMAVDDPLALFPLHLVDAGRGA